MRALKISFVALLSCILFISLPASAAPVTVSSYSMFNGAHGSFDYRDFTYVPCNAVCDVTGAALSGGTGKLTDGVSPALSWYQYGELTPWVGWDYTQLNGLNPTVTFNFPTSITITSMTVWVDNTIGYGGVYLPSSVSIDGISFPIAPDNVNPNPRAYTFSGLNLTGSSADVQFFQTSGYPWIMVGEVSFTQTPEPATMTLAASGLALAWWRRRKARS